MTHHPGHRCLVKTMKAAHHRVKDSCCPAAVPCVQEWGDPTENKTMYDYLLSYSPLDNVRAQSYPNMLVTGGVISSALNFACIFCMQLCQINICAKPVTVPQIEALGDMETKEFGCSQGCTTRV